MGHLNKEMDVNYVVVHLDCFRCIWDLLGNWRGSHWGMSSCGHFTCKWARLHPLAFLSSPPEDSSFFQWMFF